MHARHLSIYLNDHLAGAIGALELFEHLIEEHRDTPLGHLLLRIKGEVEADRAELEAIIDRLGERNRPVRKAVGWLSERLVRLKLRVDDPSDGALRLFEALEALALGVNGKEALWLALHALPADVPQLRGVDLERLAARARDQRAALESARLEAATVALCGENPGLRSAS